jgi:hypothetical protein
VSGVRKRERALESVCGRVSVPQWLEWVVDSCRAGPSNKARLSGGIVPETWSDRYNGPCRVTFISWTLRHDLVLSILQRDITVSVSVGFDN